MPKPTHVAVFDFISEGTQDEIRDYIAFGMFCAIRGELGGKRGGVKRFRAPPTLNTDATTKY